MEDKNFYYICFGESKQYFDVNGNSLGMGGDRAIYYSRSVGRRRLYRCSYPKPIYKGLSLLKFKKENNVLEICKSTNEQFNDNFKPLLIKIT